MMDSMMYRQTAETYGTACGRLAGSPGRLTAANWRTASFAVARFTTLGLFVTSHVSLTRNRR